MNSRARWKALVVACSLLPGAGLLHAQGQLPVDMQATLLVKVLTFEKTLRARMEDGLVIGIVYQPDWSLSRELKDEMTKALQAPALSQVVSGSILVIEIPLTSDNELPFDLALQHVDVVYLTPLRAVGVKRFLEAFRSAGVISFSGVEDYCRGGLAIGLRQTGKRPVIEVNLTETRGVRAEFSSQLLRLAQIVKGL